MENTVRLGCMLAVLAWSALPAVPFREPIRLSDGKGASASASLDIDAMENPVVVYESGGAIVLVGGYNGFATPLEVNGEVGPARLPAVVTTPVGSSWVVFEATPDSAPGPALYVASNPGGSFEAPERIAQGERPHAAFTPSGELLMLWEEEGAEGTEVILATAAGRVIARLPGREGHLAVDARGRVHVTWIRDGDVYVASGPPGDLASRRLTETPEAEWRPWVAVLPDGREFILYGTPGSLSLDLGAGGAPVRIVEGSEGIAGAALEVSPDGAVLVAYSDGGDLYLVRGLSGFMTSPVRLFETERAETAPVVRSDGRGVLHLVFEAEGEIWYANDAAPPRPDFALEPREGEAPLTVRFEDRSAGDVRARIWEFGDGERGSQREVEHVYTEPGAYTVTLTVRGVAGERRSITREAAVVVREPSNFIFIPDTVLFAGLYGTYIPVLGSHPNEIQGFQLALRYEPHFLRIRDVRIGYTAVEALAPEFFVPAIYPDEGVVTVGLILDMNTPFDGRTLRPGFRQRLVNLVVDVPADVPAWTETEIEPRNGLGHPPIQNIFTVQGYTIFPVLVPGTVRIVPFLPPFPRLFVRGDVDIDGKVILSDPIFLLNYLFRNGPAPACLDAGDFDDSGTVDIADPILLLQYLFANGRTPEVPFPRPGLDPTEDGLPGC